MTSLFAPEPRRGQFRVRWRGYDRAQVDEFLWRASAERQALEERLAQLEVIGVDIGGLNASFDTMRKAARLLSARTLASQEGRDSEREGSPPPSPPLDLRCPDMHREPFLRSIGAGRLLPTLVSGAVLAAMVLFFYPLEPSVSAMPPPPATTATALRFPEPAPEPVKVASRADGIVLRLTALQTCWIRASIDGGIPFERLLNPDETITLPVLDEAVLRVGDAAALSLLINDRATRPLGTSGKAVTLRITPSSYTSLLTDDTDL